MAEDKFIMLSPNGEKIRSVITFFATLFVFVVCGVLLTIYWNPIIIKLPFVGKLLAYITLNIGSFTIRGVFYSSFLCGIFFVPSPDELLFYYAISKNNLIFLTLIATLLGYMLAQAVNYYLGFKASDYILNFISKRKLYQARRHINKYGGIGIFAFNFLPFPAPLLSLGLGIAKANFKRLLIWAFLGHLAKYLIIIAIYLLVGQI